MVNVLYHRLVCSVKVNEQYTQNTITKHEMIVVDKDVALSWFHDCIVGGYDYVDLTTIVDYEDGQYPVEHIWKQYKRS